MAVLAIASAQLFNVYIILVSLPIRRLRDRHLRPSSPLCSAIPSPDDDDGVPRPAPAPMGTTPASTTVPTCTFENERLRAELTTAQRSKIFGGRGWFKYAGGVLEGAGSACAVGFDGEARIHRHLGYCLQYVLSALCVHLTNKETDIPLTAVPARGAADSEAKHSAMRRVRGRGEPAGSDEEGPHEVGSGRLPDLPAAFAARYKAIARPSPPWSKHESTQAIRRHFYFLGSQHVYGLYGLAKDVTRAVELYERAAELGVKEAHYNLGVTYNEGTDVEKDTAKAFRHFEAAAMSGDVYSRFNLGAAEYNAGNYDLALQHWMIAAKLGHEDSLDEVNAFLIDGDATRAHYAAALRGYQNAIEGMSSPDRDEAKNVDA
ncbi:hypothetical protein THAOC_13511 [Thalassiosira oceanica]|uniref:Uncharacterized protein n=1 Tax=Thalassiosira oceanica TaxID=159749 RepID=K0SXA6_THAOC|nr:hypothetical protein THAOC_13511 [Thalassiosira oceanica]|eukprot:EJK65611.1 hypothetical protein THAOC_13511 [Thalassiosira oceanica]